MKLFLFLAFIGLSVFCACRKSEDIAQLKIASYPYSDQYVGMLHVYHKYDYFTPFLTYDSTYQEVFEVVYLDSSRVFFNFYYWDYALKVKNGAAGYSQIFPSTCSTFPVSDHNQFTLGVGSNGLALVSQDSLKINYPAVTAAYNNLTITFTGKKI